MDTGSFWNENYYVLVNVETDIINTVINWGMLGFFQN